MNLSEFSIYYKLCMIAAGSIFLVGAAAGISGQMFGWEFILLLALTLITPKMSIVFPRAKFILSFSDSVIFLAFVFFNGYAAILLAAVETFANCVYLKKNGTKFARLMIPFNIASTVIATSLTFIIWTQYLKFTPIDYKSTAAESLVLTFGFLAIVQFLTTSAISTIYFLMFTEDSRQRFWRRDFFMSSLTQVVGAAFAAVAYKFLTEADFITTIITVSVFGIIYMNYRQTIRGIKESIAQAEKAELEKAEIARQKTEEANKHAAQLQMLLENEEKTNIALLKSKEALEHAAFHDFLTDLPNRMYLIERLSLLIEIGIEISHKYYVLFLDIKRFKNINDSLGHPVGDRLLKIIGKRLVRILRKEDTVARIGGDEFAIILNDLSSIEEAKEIAEDICRKLSRPFLVSGNKIFSEVNIGIAPFDADHKKPEELLRDADIAMNHAKEQGCVVGVFDKNLRARFLERVSLETDLRYAVERGELEMYYQPLISLKTGDLVGFESLIRWNHRTKGLISPVQFIPIAEDSGLIVPITQWILTETCRQLAHWQTLSQIYQDLIITVNISGKHLVDESLLKDVSYSLKAANLNPSSLKLEITESTAMDNAEHTIKVLKKLKQIGVQLSMDDFGTGYSSLSYLHRLPFDSLKIDRSFVAEVGESGEHSEILQTILSLAKNLKLHTFGEGIETEVQLALLKNLGCDYGQGYLFSKPLPRHKMEALLYQKHSWFPPTLLDEFNDINDLQTDQPHVF